jgi:hypothetical protein
MSNGDKKFAATFSVVVQMSEYLLALTNPMTSASRRTEG